MNVLQDAMDWFREPLLRLLDALVNYFPILIGALAILLAGWVGAYLLRWIVLRFGTGLDAILTTIYRRTGRKPLQSHWNLSRVVANIVFWIVILFSLTGASDLLGLTALAEWLRELAFYLPRLLISGLILLIGYMLSGVLRDATTGLADSAGSKHGSLFGRAMGILVLGLALLMALDQLGLDVTLLSNLFTLAVASVFGGAAIAFGVGAGDAVRNIVSAHYIRKTYKPGQRVRVANLEGQIIELTPVAVVVETAEGPALIPARVFSEGVSLAVDTSDETEY